MKKFKPLPYQFGFPERELVGAIYQIDEWWPYTTFRPLGHLQDNFGLTLEPIVENISNETDIKKERKFKLSAEAAIKKLVTFNLSAMKAKSISYSLKGLESKRLWPADVFSSNQEIINNPQKNKLFQFLSEFGPRLEHFELDEVYYVEASLGVQSVLVKFHDENSAQIKLEPGSSLTNIVSDAKIEIEHMSIEGDGTVQVNFPVHIGYIRRPISELLPTTAPGAHGLWSGIASGVQDSQLLASKANLEQVARDFNHDSEDQVIFV